MVAKRAPKRRPKDKRPKSAVPVDLVVSKTVDSIYPRETKVKCPECKSLLNEVYFRHTICSNDKCRAGFVLSESETTPASKIIK